MTEILYRRHAGSGSDDHLPGPAESPRYTGRQSSYRKARPRAYSLDILVSSFIALAAVFGSRIAPALIAISSTDKSQSEQAKPSGREDQDYVSQAHQQIVFRL